MCQKKQKEEADGYLARWNMGRFSIGAKDLRKAQAEAFRSVNLVLKSGRTRLEQGSAIAKIRDHSQSMCNFCVFIMAVSVHQTTKFKAF